MNPRPWVTLGELAAVLHVSRLTAWRLLRPHRSRCHLARAGHHPRLVLWVPLDVVRHLEGERPRVWLTVDQAPGETPVKPLSP